MNSFYEKYKECSQKELNEAFIEACRIGCLEEVKYLLTSPELNIHADISANQYGGFINVTIHMDLTLIRYLLTSSELKNHADIHARQEAALHWATISGNFPLVQYLLTSPELSEHANIHENESACFRYACENKNYEIMKYLLTSPELKENTNREHAFRDVCNHKNIIMAKYLIFELNLPRTKKINKILKEYPSTEITALFNVRDLANQLHAQTPLIEAQKKVINKI